MSNASESLSSQLEIKPVGNHYIVVNKQTGAWLMRCETLAAAKDLVKSLAVAVLLVLGLASSAFAQTPQTAPTSNAPLFIVSYSQTDDVGHPCGDGLKGPAAPVVKNGRLVLVFTCKDDRVHIREYFEMVIEPPVPVPPNPSPFPHSFPCAHIPGFVESVGGGCVPPNHPAARKN